MTCGRQRQRVAVLDARDSGRTCRQQSHDTERKHVRPPTGGIYARPSQRSTPARPLAASAWWLGGMRRVVCVPVGAEAPPLRGEFAERAVLRRRHFRRGGHDLSRPAAVTVRNEQGGSEKAQGCASTAISPFAALLSLVWLAWRRRVGSRLVE